MKLKYILMFQTFETGCRVVVMHEQLPPKPEDYPIGRVLRKTRESSGISVKDYQEQLQDKAKEMGYDQLNLFKDGDRNSYSEPERKAFIRKRKERLEAICEVLQLPSDLFMRHNEVPVLGFALNSVFLKGQNAQMYCQTSMFPSDPRQMYSSEHSASSHIIEAMSHFLLQSQGGITFVSRRSNFIGATVVSAALLLAHHRSQDPKYLGSWADSITESSELVAKHCIGQSGLLKIPYTQKHFNGFLKRMSVHVLNIRKNNPNDIAKMAQRDPVTYWMISNKNNLRGFISLGQRSFLELSDFDTRLLEERFNIATNPASDSFDTELPYSKMKELKTVAKEKLYLEFEEIKTS